MNSNLKYRFLLIGLISTLMITGWPGVFFLQDRPPKRGDLIIFTNPIEPAINPPCNCSGVGDPIGIKGFNSCSTTNAIPCLSQDTGALFLHNGEFVYSAVDLEIPGRGINWKFSRRYRSGIIYDGPLGHNWEFNYNRRLVVATEGNLKDFQKTFRNAKEGDIALMDGYGRADLYTKNQDGSYNAPSGFYTELRGNAEGEYSLLDPCGSNNVYGLVDDIYYVTSQTDRNNNTMLFKYNEKGQLIKVLDTYSRPISYFYHQNGRLTEVRDFYNRSIKFKYDRNGNLVAVTTPEVNGTPNGNNFPKGKTELYTYSSGFDNDMLNHNLLTIIAPNESARRNLPRVVVEYETDPNNHHVDRVLSQTVGGTNWSGIPAGGTIHYEYWSLKALDSSGINSPVAQTNVIDRNGNTTEYLFNQLGNVVRIREFTNRKFRENEPEFFETEYEYNKDGKLIRIIFPEGNSVEYIYNDTKLNRRQQGNLLYEIQQPDSSRGGDQHYIEKSFTHEPIYNKIHTLTDPRGNDPRYIPENGGNNTSQRYTTINTFDYQEGKNFAALAKVLGITEIEVRTLLQEANVPMGLGDINHDGRTDQIAGNVIRTTYPTVNLLPSSKMIKIEGSSRQKVEEFSTFNDFGRLLRRVDPEGNVTVYEYNPENDPDGDGKNLIPGKSDRPFGYVKTIIQDAESNAIRNSSTNPEPARIKKQYFYDPVGKVVKIIDGRGIATEYIYNQLNRIVEIHRASDISIVLRNPEEPKWSVCKDTSLVECHKGMVAFNYRVRFFYDHNDNIVKREVENKDSNNPRLAGSWITYEYAYDILDNLIEEREEVSENPREIRVKKYRYDRNENRILEIEPVANLPTSHPERQPSNIKSYVFDERDLCFTFTRGGLTKQFKQLGAHADIPELRTIPSGPDISTITRRYDSNRNLIKVIDGADNTGDRIPESTIFLYDGFDRQVSEIDALGKQIFIEYNPASKLLRISNFGPVGGSSPMDNNAAIYIQPLTLSVFTQPSLSRVEFRYDELSRIIERNDNLIIYENVNYRRTPVVRDGPVGVSNDGLVTTRYEYDRKSRISFLIEDDGSTLKTYYDGADRVIRKIDSELNEIQYSYDDNNNIVKILEVEIAQPEAVHAGKVPDLKETFIILNVYDSLNRIIRKSNNIGETERFVYDSRNNLLKRSDALNYTLIDDPLGLFPVSGQKLQGNTQINRPGNTIIYLYDAINRRIAEVTELKVKGQGENPIDIGNPFNSDGKITIDFDWDANSRLVARADDGSSIQDNNTTPGFIDNGNITKYEYDNLDRLVLKKFDDGTTIQYIYDADDNYTRIVDENGSVIDQLYDGLNRLIRVKVKRTEGVIGTTLQEFEYDGLSRTTKSFDNNDPDNLNDNATVIYNFDSMNRLLEEVQNGYVISSQWDGDSKRRLSLIYPNRRQVDYTYDKLDRVATIKNQGSITNIVETHYIGPNRGLERCYQNGLCLTSLDDSRTKLVGYDGIKRIVNYRLIKPNGSLVAGFKYKYDRADNMIFEQRLHDEGGEDTYDYDSIYRLTGFMRKDTITNRQSFRFDGVGNWVSLSTNGDDMIPKVNNMNEYEKFEDLVQIHDDNGNLKDDAIHRYEYDFMNRLTRVTRKADIAVIASYTYDAHGVNDERFPFLGRRITRSVLNSQELNNKTLYLYDLLNVIEQRDKSSIQQYVYGKGFDNPITLDKDKNKDGVLDESFIYHMDVKSCVIALTDSAGAVVERVIYDAYGRPTFQDPSNRKLDTKQSNLCNPYLFNARRYDPETGFYYYRTRYLNSKTGRFIQRDPLGQVNVTYRNLENPYTYTANNPIKFRDPLGLKVCLDCKIGGGVYSPGIIEDDGGGGNGGGGAGTSASRCIEWKEKFKIGRYGISGGIECCAEAEMDIQCLGEIEMCLNCSFLISGSVPIATIYVGTLGLSAGGSLQCDAICVNSKGELKSMFTSISALKEYCKGCVTFEVFGELTVYIAGLKCSAGGEFCMNAASSKLISIIGECCAESCIPWVGCWDYCPITLKYTWDL